MIPAAVQRLCPKVGLRLLLALSRTFWLLGLGMNLPPLFDWKYVIGTFLRTSFADAGLICCLGSGNRLARATFSRKLCWVGIWGERRTLCDLVDVQSHACLSTVAFEKSISSVLPLSDCLSSNRDFMANNC